MTTQEILRLQTAINQSNVRRAAELSLAEKFRLGADLYDDGIRWMKELLIAQNLNGLQSKSNWKLDRRRLIRDVLKRLGLFARLWRKIVLGMSSFDALVQVLRVLQQRRIPTCSWVHFRAMPMGTLVRRKTLILLFNITMRTQ